MTAPDDPTPPSPSADWEETRDTLGKLFQGGTAEAAKAAAQEAEPAPPEAAALPVQPDPETPREAAAFEERGDAPRAEGAAEHAAPSPAPAAPASPVPEVPERAETIKVDAPQDTSETSAPSVEAPVEAQTEVAPPPEPAPIPVPSPIPAPSPTPAPVAAEPSPAPASTSAQAGGAPGSAAGAEVSAPSAPQTTSGTDAAPGGFSDDLEEQILAPSMPAAGPQAGQVVDGYHLNEDLGRGWFTANEVTSGPSQDVYVRPDPLWALLLPHRMLPRSRPVGKVRVMEPVEGERLKPPLAAPLALGYLTELARLLYALEKQGYGVADLDPQALRLTPGGLKLRFPPRVVRLGEVSDPVLREGFTPPEVLERQPMTAKTGVHLLGATLYHWLTGQTLPPEGATLSVLGAVSSAGLPQLLYQTLAPARKRLTPKELLDVLKAKTTAPLPAYQVAAATTVGLNPDRPTNEDSYGFTWHQIDADGFPEQVLRAVVSDGMGGMAAGEVASRAAVRAFLGSDKDNMVDLVWDANAAVLDAMQGRDGGCTISAVQLSGERLELGHVGDTRAYLRRGGQVQQISKDHSYVAAMVASGQMTPEEAQNSPDRNKVLRSLGSIRVPQVNYVFTLPEPLALAVGDRVLLVSDGVWGEVEDARLKPLLDTEPNLQMLVDTLIGWSLDSGAPDNATALVIERVK